MQTSRRVNVVLWILQGFFALFFGLASGLPKLLLPQAMLGMPLSLPEAFIKFIGTAELLGAIGLILPGLVRTRSGLTLLAAGLTPLAAAGLAFVALSATVYQFLASQSGNAVFALVLAVSVAGLGYTRWRVAPLPGAPSAPARADSSVPVTLIG